MKKRLIVVGLTFSLCSAYAQKSVYSEAPEGLFTQGQEMFLGNNYLGAIQSLERYKSLSKDPQQIQEAEYIIVASQYYRGEAIASQALKDYLTTYPSTMHRNQLCFMIGSTHFANKEWKLALYWFEQADDYYLRGTEKADYLYRRSYASLQDGDLSGARRGFAILTRTSQTYSDAASYYLAYIDFQEGNYDQAIAVFSLLRANPEFKENATFFLIQSEYLKGNYGKTIEEGLSYLASYPNTSNVVEINRLLGGSYYKLGDDVNALKYYERYLNSSNTKYFREDMYQIGELYYEVGNYNKAITMLKRSASSDDLLGQASNMLLGESYHALGDVSNALMAFDVAARLKFDRTISEDALYNFVMLTNQRVDVFGESITAFQRFLTTYPNSKYTDSVNKALASTLLSTQNYDMALDAINQIKNPGRPILEAKQIILYQQGVQAFINGNYDLALVKFNASIDLGNYDMDVKKESFFWRAEAEYRLGKFADAASDYSTYVAEVSLSEKNYLPALYNLGYANFQLKDYNKALNSFSRYTSMETNKALATYADALNRVGDCYLFRRDFTAAERYYNDAITADPKNSDYAQFQKAFVLGLQHKYNEKIEALNKMMVDYPNSPYVVNALFEQSRAYVMLNKDKQAIHVLDKLLKEYPKSSFVAKAGVQLGQLYFNNNDADKAISAYKRVIAEAPNTAESAIAVKSLEAVYKDINDVNTYVAYVNSLGGGKAISSSRQDTLVFQAAENVFMKGRKDEAKKSFVSYLEAYPNGSFSGDAHFYLGNMAFEAKNKSEALVHFKEVIALNNPKYIDDALIFASGIEYDNQNYEEAYKMYQHLNAVTSNTANRNTARLGLLRTSYLLNEDNRVIESANQLLQNTSLSDDVVLEARFYRGKSLKNVGKQAEALKDLKEVGKNTRTAFGAESQYLAADILFEQGNYDETEKQILVFMQSGTPHEYWMARAVVVLSDVYQAKGDNFQAKQYLESLQANYKGGEADVSEMISERLAGLATE